ncbi:Glutathione S-transferase U16 [Exaiptasia diaphana]|nr:Glutathione S-transferase U16 [Exaiptasia diaphana]
MSDNVRFQSVAPKMGDSKPKAYIAWFCPYAQRAHIALLAKKVDFEYIEQNPYNKTPEWMAISRNGLVPVIIHNGNTVYESDVCVEYIDGAFNSDVSLMPKDPYQRAYARMWGAFLVNKILPNMFGMMLKLTEKEQEEAKEKCLEGLKEFTAAMSPNHEFFQQDTLSYVDILFAPFREYFPIMKEACVNHKTVTSATLVGECIPS